jgi:hypothetical protein
VPPYNGPVTADIVVYALFGALLAFGIYRRLHGTFARQRIRPGRMRTRIVLLGLIGAWLVVSLPTPAGFGAAVAGGAVGVVLAHLGVARTVFERTDQGSFYTPSKWIGGAVTALFLGRLAVRLYTAFELAKAAAESGEPLSGLHRSALTVAFYFLFAGYYVAYYLWILKRVAADAPLGGSR